MAGCVRPRPSGCPSAFRPDLSAWPIVPAACVGGRSVMPGRPQIHRWPSEWQVFPGLASIPLAHVGGQYPPAAVITPEPPTAEEFRRCRRSISAWRLTSRHGRLRAPSPVWISVGLQARPVRLPIARCGVGGRPPPSAIVKGRPAVKPPAGFSDGRCFQAWRRCPWPMSVVSIHPQRLSRPSRRRLRASADVGDPSAVQVPTDCPDRRCP
jgi:hypothetical protein